MGISKKLSELKEITSTKEGKTQAGVCYHLLRIEKLNWESNFPQKNLLTTKII